MERVQQFILPGFLVAVIAYLLGSISFSIIFTKVFDHKMDIRTMGSGNAGATNVLRSVGKLPALFTTIFDFGKGAASVLIGQAVFRYFCGLYGAPDSLAHYGAYVAGFACILGHIFPVYFGFRGGKGVLTCAAMMALIDWRVFLCCISVFLIVFLITKIVSLSSIIGSAAYPLFTFLLSYFVDYRAGAISIAGVWFSTAAAFVIAAVVIGKHHSNMKRILNGTEKKITDKSAKEKS